MTPRRFNGRELEQIAYAIVRTPVSSSLKRVLCSRLERTLMDAHRDNMPDRALLAAQMLHYLRTGELPKTVEQKTVEQEAVET